MAHGFAVTPSKSLTLWPFEPIHQLVVGGTHVLNLTKKSIADFKNNK